MQIFIFLTFIQNNSYTLYAQKNLNIISKCDIFTHHQNVLYTQEKFNSNIKMW